MQPDYDSNDHFHMLENLVDAHAGEEQLLSVMTGRKTINDVRRELGLPADSNEVADRLAVSEPYSIFPLIGKRLADKTAKILRENPPEWASGFLEKVQDISKSNRDIMLNTEGFEDIGYRDRTFA